MQDLLKIKDEIIENIKTAAHQGEIKTISKWSKAAEKCQYFIEELTDLNSRIIEFKNSLWIQYKKDKNTLNSTSDIYDSNIVKPKLTPRQQGEKIRSSWVQNLHSKKIFLSGRGKRYSTNNGKMVGVASANELSRSQLVDKWFLGLKDEPTDIVVLLCCDLEGELYDIVIPVVSLEKSWKKLSRSNGQIKFHVQRRIGDFFLSVPGNDPISISVYIKNYQPFIS